MNVDNFHVEFIVAMPNPTDEARYKIAEFIAERLSVSLMLKELRVNNIKVGGYEFDLEARRKRNRRSSFQ
jgi:hypothetical protein